MEILSLLANDHHKGQLLRESAHQYGQLIGETKFPLGTDPSDKFSLATDLINGQFL